MVVWQEREHELNDIRGENDACIVNSLHGYGLLKLFNVPSMRSQLRLLEYILRMWNPKQQYFEVGAHILTVEVEEIYFLTCLSRRGAPISLIGP